MKKLLSFCITLCISIYSFSQASNTFAGAALIPTSATCISGTNSFTHTLSGANNQAATISGVSCGAASNTPDVWYKFTTQTAFPIVTVLPTGSSWVAGTQIKVQVLSGTVLTALAEVACANSSSSTPTLPATINNTPVTAVPGTALNPGTTYYVRISKTGTGLPTGGTWDYNICIKEGTASRMNEVFSRTILSGPSVMNYPWEVTYGPDNMLWITESKGYKVTRMNPSDGTPTLVLDISQNSTFLPLADRTFNCQFANGSGAQGGLAGLALHPKFMNGLGDETNYVYISYVRSGSGSYFTNRIARFFYNKATGKLESPVSVCDSLPGSNDHNSQRMIIAPDPSDPTGPKFLFYASGDMGAGQGNVNNITLRPIKAQMLNSYEGKILRFNLEEDTDPVQTPTTMNYNRWIPNDNPYNGTLTVQSAVWTIGIRNNQGFAYDATANILYGISHGAYSDDELNILNKKTNYGHPLIIGYADGNYDGNTNPGSAGNNLNISAGAPYNSPNTTFGNGTCPPIGSETTRVGELNALSATKGPYQEPLFSAYAGPTTGTGSVKYIWQNTDGSNGSWPSEAWSGLDLYTNKVIPGWKQSLVAAGLKWGRLIRLKLGATGTTTLPSNLSYLNTGDTITNFQSLNRYRDLAFAPNGKDIFIVMDHDASTSGPGTNNPVTPACPDCVIKYSFLGYVNNGSTTFGGSTIPKSIDVSVPVANNVCTPATTVTINAANNNNRLWVPITGPDGNILAEINAMGQDLGVVTTSFYKNSNAIRVKGGTHYLDRNITITPTTQPGSTVKVRLYISKAEFDLLDADGASGITPDGRIDLLKVLKNSDACGGSLTTATTAYTPTNIGTNPFPDLQQQGSTGTVSGYVYQIDIPSFSSFYFATTNVTLPLDLLTFTGSLQTDKTTLLKWKTENEINTSNFIIERSADAVNFTNIGKVAAAGNNSGALNYSFVDNDAANQQSLVLFYRLKMTDINGDSKFSNVISVSFADITGAVNVAPNPVTHEATVTIIAPADGRVQYKLVDNSGRTILQKGISVRKGANNNITLDMNKLSSGVYFLNVTGAGLSKNIKLQKL